MISRDREVIARVFNEYVQAFQSLKPSAAASYCQAPCMFIAPQGVRLMATSSEIESFFQGIMSALKARDYLRSAITDLRVNPMSEESAVVSVGRVRYRTDGRELERLGETYILRSPDGDWKIVAALVHDFGAILMSA
jgi:ketosteroid isomerase-like protein